MNDVYMDGPYRFELDAKPTGGNAQPRTVRLVHYPDGWDLVVGIGPPGRQARAAATLTPHQARELAAELIERADIADAVEADRKAHRQ